MLTYFLCPDGVKRPIKECLEHCSNPDGRCLSLPTLYEIGKVRKQPILKCPCCGMVISADTYTILTEKYDA